jgi:hypothetical protein
MTFLSKVEKVFMIEGRGCVIAPGLTETTPPEIALRPQDPIELRKPDGAVIRTQITAVEFLDGPKRKSCIAIVLPSNFLKSDIPTGTEIWLIDG